MSENIIAKILIRHEPRKDIDGYLKTAGATPYDPYTEYVIFAVIPNIDSKGAEEIFLSDLLYKCNHHPADHTTDFLYKDTALDDIHSIVRTWRGMNYRLSWDFAEFWHVTNEGAQKINRHQFFDLVRDSVSRTS